MTILHKLEAGLTTRSSEEMRAAGAALAGALPANATLALHGDLGAGKTTFVQGLARGLGIAGHVTSPTYTLYSIHTGAGRMLAHLDAYRIAGPAEAEALLIEEFLREPWCLAVEWPEHVADWLPADAWHLDLALAADQSHTIRLRPLAPPT